MDEVTQWEFRVGFKHLFVGNPATTVCSLAPPELVEELIANSDVEVPDTATCWLCLALEDWAKKQQIEFGPRAFR